MNLVDWIGPGVILAVVLFVWRDLKHDFRTLSTRFDRHLEGHPRCP